MNEKPSRPLYEALKRYASLEPARFHMPGHKGGLYAFDVTEVEGTDDLSSPSGPILELESICAEAFGSRDALVSVNGSTAANIAMLLCLGEGKRVLMARNCHKSVINGMALAGHNAVLLPTDSFGIVAPEAVDAALTAAPCDAVFITSPTYRGFTCDIAGIASAAHSHGALLFVDCAHGAHFAFSSALPAVPSEADMWCVSCHKTLEALNQTSVLNLGAYCPVTKEEARRALLTVQTTSPSYPLMLSIEHAVTSPADWEGHIKRIEAFKKSLGCIGGAALLQSGTAYDADPTRLNIHVDGLNGHQLERILIENAVYPEMSDLECITLITAPSDKDEWYAMLFEALSKASSVGRLKSAEAAPSFVAQEFSPCACNVRAAVFGEKAAVDLRNSIGRVCASAAGIYPPGCAILFPGEVIERKAVDALVRELDAGADPFGLYDGKVLVRAEKDGGGI